MGGEVSLWTLSSMSATEPRTMPMPSARCPVPRDRCSAVSAVRLISASLPVEVESLLDQIPVRPYPDSSFWLSLKTLLHLSILK